MVLATSFLVLVLILLMEILIFMEIWVRSVRDLPSEFRFETIPVEFDFAPRDRIERLDETKFRFEPSRPEWGV